MISVKSPFQFLQVRDSVCVVGPHAEAVQWTKRCVAQLIDHPIPLESFHMRSRSDLEEGALLVPKVILTASHCPGQRLLDEEGDEGVLDYIYDKVCDVQGMNLSNVSRLDM